MKKSARRRQAPSSGPRLRVMLGPVISIGPGKADLLEAIIAHGSISAAAKSLGMSYRRAWTLVDTMNRCFRDPLVWAATGGEHGGGATVTPGGREVLARYRRMEAKAAKAVASELAAFSSLLRPEPGPGE